MVKKQLFQYFGGGISDFPKLGIEGSFAFARSIDIRSNPNQITILPRTVKESGSTVEDLIKWAQTYNSTLLTYFYGDTGKIYSRSSAASYTLLRTVAASHGNGLVYSPEDDYLYYARDKLIGRYGPLGGTASFVDDYFGSQGGVPLNTHVLDLESGSSQYASRADTASLSITGDLAIDMQIKPESFPASGAQQVLVSKWDESGSTRSYKFDIATTSGYFGDGSDGALTISSNTTEAPIDSACTGTTGTTSLSATNASFAAGQIILIHQTQGTGAGLWERNTISSYVAGTITTVDALSRTYTTGAQVRVLKQHTDVTINSGITYTAKAWTGTVGGIIGWVASGTVTVTGTVTANGLTQTGTDIINSRPATGGGFIGGDTVYNSNSSKQGDGTTGTGSVSSSANGNGGGAGGGSESSNPSAGAGGGNGTAGTAGSNNGGTGGTAGSASGSADLTTMTFGGGGGGGGWQNNNRSAMGGNGGGIVFITGSTLTVTGSITANGGAGQTQWQNRAGGGAGGSILLKAQTATLGAALITASGGAGSANGGGAGGDGRIHLDYYTSYTGTTTPTLDVDQDNSLVTNESQQLRLSVSSTGANSEVLTKTASLTTGSWQQVGVSWDASASTATFFLNGVSLGTSVGTLTAIHDNASTFQIGMSKSGAGAAEKFYDGKMDEVRVFNAERTAAQMLSGISSQISTTTTGLQAYYKLNNGYTDATANANNLTASGSPVFTTDVPYPSPTTRLDIDQSLDTTGSTYAVPTTISEAATDRQTFTPSKDPQKSIQFNVVDKGTGTWTVTIHDVNNNVMATSTVTNANMTTGDYEFTYSSVWRPLTNFTNEYHAHVTCASGSPTITTTSSNDMETADFVTYYQFLVEDTAWHPMAQFLNFWVVGNERYVGKYEATLYEPHKVVLQSGWRIRSFALWREFLAIGVMRGTNITDFDSGRIYFWDGASSTFNYFIDVPEGGINAMLGSRGKLYVWAGYKNQLLEYSGGDTAQKIKDMPKMEVAKYSEIYPGAVTMWQSLLRYGVAGNGDSTAINKGVYTWGSTNNKFPEILTYDYPPSTQVYTGTDQKVGMLTVVDQKLLMSWQSGISYGVDYVANSNSPFTSAYVDFLLDDVGDVVKEKEAIQIAAHFDSLAASEGVTLSYAMEGSSSFTANTDTQATSDTLSRLIINNSRYNELQTRVTLTADTTAPTIKGLSLKRDALESEDRD